jgi:hypothetical protein
MITVALAALLLPPADKLKTINHKVEIDGRTYRVEVKGRTVEVFDKSIMTKRTPEAGEKLRAAVNKATGCEIRDWYWQTAHLAGILDCSALAPAAASTP